MRALGLLLLAALPVPPAAAQSIEDGFRQAHAIFGNTSAEWDTAVAGTEALLPRLAGRWIALDVIAGGPPPPPGQGPRYEEFCTGIVLDLVVTSRLGFDLVRSRADQNDAPRTVTNFDYAGFSTFVRSRRTGDLLDLFGIPDDQPVMPSTFGGLLPQSTVTLYHPSHDILVLVDGTGRAEYLGRCP